MNYITRFGILLGSLLAAGSSYASSVKAVKAAENIDAIATAGGSATYTISLWLGILLILVSVGTWVWTSREDAPQGKGKGRLIIISAIAGVILTFPSAWIAWVGEAVEVVPATESVDYRDLQNS